MQIRNCWDFNQCGTRAKAPSISRACGAEEKAPQQETSQNAEQQQQVQPEITGRGSRGLNSFIILTLGKYGGATAFLVLMLIVVAVYVAYRYKRNHPRGKFSGRYAEIPRSRIEK